MYLGISAVQTGQDTVSRLSTSGASTRSSTIFSSLGASGFFPDDRPRNLSSVGCVVVFSWLGFVLCLGFLWYALVLAPPSALRFFDAAECYAGLRVRKIQSMKCLPFSFGGGS